MTDKIPTPLPRILLADDEPTFLSATAEMFRLKGMTCFTAGDSNSALDLYTREPLDAIVADIRMPGNADLEFVQRLRELEATTPVILLTGYPSMETAIASVRLPVFDYLLKPVRFEDLLATVRAAVIEFRAGDALRRLRVRLASHKIEFELLEDAASTAIPTTTTEFDAFVAALFGNLSDTLTDLMRLVRSGAGWQLPDSEDVCRTMACPRLIEYRAAIASAIDVLEDTKRSFKSKELGQLKRNLQTLIDAPFGSRGRHEN